jgi:hypothetical protein
MTKWFGYCTLATIGLEPILILICKFWVGKFASGVKAKHCWALKKFVDITQQCFALLPQVQFPANNLNFTEGDGIKSGLSS